VRRWAYGRWRIAVLEVGGGKGKRIKRIEDMGLRLLEAKELKAESSKLKG